MFMEGHCAGSLVLQAGSQRLGRFAVTRDTMRVQLAMPFLQMVGNATNEGEVGELATVLKCLRKLQRTGCSKISRAG